jgi:hypothetical protein
VYAHKVVPEPVNIKPTLQRFVFCLGIGLAPLARHPTAEGGVKRFHMIGMNVVIGQHGRRMIAAGAHDG